MSHVLLKWDAIVENASALTFQLKRHDKPDVIYAGKDTTYKDEDVVVGATYVYTLTAMSGNGIYSNPYTLKVVVKERLEDFKDILTVVSSTKEATANILWNELGDGVIYNVQVRQGTTIITSLDQTGTSFVVTDIEPNKLYIVEVTAKKSGYNPIKGNVSFEIDYLQFNDTLSITATPEGKKLSSMLAWTNLGAGVSYQLVIRKGSTVVMTYNETGVSKNITGLQTGVTYVVDITASKKNYTSVSASTAFELINQDFGPFSVDVVKDDINLSADVTWNSLDSNVVYYLTLTANGVVNKTFTTSSTSKKITGLVSGVEYKAEVKATREGYNPTTSSVLFRLEDKTKPVVRHTVSGSGSSRIITVTATDVGSGVDRIVKPDNTISYSASTNFTANSNGRYLFEVYDKAGNKESYFVTLTDIPVNTAPVVVLKASTTDWTRSNVLVSITATDLDGIASLKWTKYSQNVTYFRTDGTELGTSRSFYADSNGTYTVYAKDGTGWEVVQTIFIGNIDKEGPKMSHNKTDNTVTIYATDSLSGLDKIILPDSTSVKSSPATFTTTKSGNYSFQAHDKAGNVSYLTVSIGAGDIPNTPGSSIAKQWRVASSPSHSLFVTANGSVYGAGTNTNGQLGLGHKTNEKSVTRISTLSNVSSVACGHKHSLFLLKDGTVYACGTGEATGLNSTGDVTVPTKITSLSGVVAIAAGSDHSVFLLGDGSVYSCGLNNQGQLGLSSNGLLKQKVPALISGFPNKIVDIRADGQWTFFTMVNMYNEKILYTTGDNNFGRIGGGYTDDVWTPREIKITGADLPNVPTSSIDYVDTNAGVINFFDGDQIYGSNVYTSYMWVKNGQRKVSYNARYVSGKYILFEGHPNYKNDTLYEIDVNGQYSAIKESSFFKGQAKSIVEIINNEFFVLSSGSVYAVGYNTGGKFGLGHLESPSVPTWISTITV